MKLEAYNWNVVIAGYWNRAILTPKGISRRLFDIPEGTPVLVEVPIDGIMAPYRVKHNGLTITPDMGRLVIEADDPQYKVLDYAKKIGALAIERLPETPLSAAGYNIRIKVIEPPEQLILATTSTIDDLLSDAGHTIINGRSLKRSLTWDEGIVNLNIDQDEDMHVEINFHRQSSKPDDLISWLNKPIENIQEFILILYDKVFGLNMGGIGA